MSHLDDGRRILARVSARIRDERMALGFSQRRLAARAGLSPSQVFRIERGLHCPAVDTLVRLADGLGTTASLLLIGIKGERHERARKADEVVRSLRSGGPGEHAAARADRG